MEREGIVNLPPLELRSGYTTGWQCDVKCRLLCCEYRKSCAPYYASVYLPRVSLHYNQ